MVERQYSRDDSLLHQYQVLLEITEAIATQRSLSSLFRLMAGHLQRVTRFDFISIVLHDPERNAMRLALMESTRINQSTLPQELPIEESPSGRVWQTQQPLILDYEADAAEYRQFINRFRQHGINSCCVVPLSSAGRRLGAICFGSAAESAYSEADLPFLQQVARQVAVAVDNALNFESARSSEQQLARERDRSQLLLEINNAVVTRLGLRELLQAISACLRRVMHHDFAGLMLYDSESKRLRAHALDFPDHQSFVDFLSDEGGLIPLEGTRPGLAFTTRRTVLRSRLDLAEFTAEINRRVRDEHVQAACHVPLISHDRTLGVLTVASLREDAFTQEDAEMLEQIAGQVAIAVENALAYREIEALKNKLAEEKLYLEDEIRTERNFEEIIGSSPALKRVLKQVETVAPTDAPVLICGETGTGKELIARAIHNLSDRRERTLVKLNCAAIPTGLLESELFGHEKGAFTGATAQRIGRFELAHRGTLFLDEVGEIPLELQPKLLRVLQDQEFERVGSSRTIRVDVRLVAATNRDLAQMVGDKEFRSDLFYRLNVFPVTLPPLRERGDDIVLLANYFAQKYRRQFKKRIDSMSQNSLERLREYNWPGNIRELENFIERAVLISEGDVLTFDSPFTQAHSTTSSEAATPSQPGLRALEEMERDYITQVLRRTNGMIAGKGGAAEILGLPASTLRSRMKRLKIT